MSTLTDQGDAAAAAALHEAFPDVTGEPQEFRGDWRVAVETAAEVELIRYARDELGFELFVDRMGADQGPDADPRFDVITCLYNLASHTRLIVMTTLPAARPSCPTLIGVFRGANWFEREIYDMYGVSFTGHPNLTRILMPDEFDAFPLRKEYPMEGLGAFGAPRRALGGNVDGTDGHVAIPPHPGQPGAPTRDPLLGDDGLLPSERALLPDDGEEASS
ncbi:MAG: NADH-quinone oxidoreductase subunit C [Planctomycetota bacterium]|nr:MAG: NADH-quinone oxidoreductase subunit C [Planctomycetota bacterium]